MTAWCGPERDRGEDDRVAPGSRAHRDPKGPMLASSLYRHDNRQVAMTASRTDDPRPARWTRKLILLALTPPQRVRRNYTRTSAQHAVPDPRAQFGQRQQVRLAGRHSIDFARCGPRAIVFAPGARRRSRRLVRRAAAWSRRSAAWAGALAPEMSYTTCAMRRLPSALKWLRHFAGWSARAERSPLRAPMRGR
jgi:hypothetical protein